MVWNLLYLTNIQALLLWVQTQCYRSNYTTHEILKIFRKHFPLYLLNVDYIEKVLNFN